MLNFNLILDCIDPKTAVAVVGPTQQTQTVDEPDKTPEELEKEKQEQKRLKAEQEKLLQQELRYKQDQLSALQRTSANQPPPDVNLQNVEKQEEVDQEEVKHRENVDLVNQLSQQNQQMQQQQQNVLMTTQMQKTSRHWIRSERANAEIIFNNNTELFCDVAATPRQQASGLQAYDKLDIDRGLWFPQNNRRMAAFHMGDVQYPIDIIFVDNDKIAKIVDNVMPGQPGSWSSVCTDVIETNGNWTIVNNVNPGDLVITPTNKLATRTSYDPLRSLTEASDDDEDWEEDLLKTFPALKKKAQENKSVKPDSYNREPGDFDKRNPTERFEHNTLPDEFSPSGDGSPIHLDPLSSPSHGSVNWEHFDYTQGSDPALSESERESITPVQPESSGLKAPTRAGAKIDNLSGLTQSNINKLMYGLIILLMQNPLEWGPSSNSEYSLETVIDNQSIDAWISSLPSQEWEEDDKNTLKEILHTDTNKKMLGQVLQNVVTGIRGFEIKDSNLHLYR